MKHYDVGIVGGSFSGLMYVQSAAVQGLKTIVFERKKRQMLIRNQRVFLLKQ